MKRTERQHLKENELRAFAIQAREAIDERRRPVDLEYPHLLAVDWLAGFRLLLARRFRGGGQPCDFRSTSLSLRGVA